MAGIDYEFAAKLLRELFAEAEQLNASGPPPSVEPDLALGADTLYNSKTQSFREALLGCGIARIVDRQIDIRLPYVSQGVTAFNGRTLDERVVNPFLQEQLIPCSKGPYLASFRRSVSFTSETASGLRDKAGYQSMLEWIVALENADASTARELVVFLLYRFILLRNASRIALVRIGRFSLDHFRELVAQLLQTPSGGVLPVLLTVAMLKTLKHCYRLPWEIASQGINVSDKSSGVGGDVTVSDGKKLLLAIEVTERVIDKARVVATFNSKIVHAGVEDYLFIYANAAPAGDAREAALNYFSHGHEINFVQIHEWILGNLTTIGAQCRQQFIRELLLQLDSRDIPAAVKMAWNKIASAIVNDKS